MLFHQHTEQIFFFFFLCHAHECPVALFLFFWSIWGCLCLFEKENWGRRGDVSWQLVTGLREGEAACATLGSPWTLGPQPAFLGFFFTLWMSENWFLSPLTAQTKCYLRKMWLQFPSWCWHWAVCPAGCWPVAGAGTLETNGLKESGPGNREGVSPKPAWDIFWTFANIFLYTVSSWLSAGILNMVPHDWY